MNRTRARENAFIILFESECRPDETPLEIFEYSVQFPDFECNDYVKRVFFGVHERRREIDELIEASLIGWNKKRISPTSRAILSLATYEMLALDDVPVKVCINEAVELSKKYDDDKTYSFVNGVLNSVAERLKLK